MLTALQIYNDIVRVTEKVIAAGISSGGEKMPSMKTEGNISIIGISGVKDIAVALKNMPYNELHSVLEYEGFFNFRLADGGLVQMIYLFKDDKIWKHKLGYFPSPTFESFQNEEELYMEDCIYLEILDKRVLPVAIRFDYDCTDGVFTDLIHPKSHLTLGQYKNCRIPVCSPITPSLFVEFILRSFYNTALRNFSEKISFDFIRFDQNATEKEMDRIHIRIR